MTHDESCPRKGKWYVSKDCREFSTDGTAMGAFIAHTFGTTDEDEIQRIGEERDKAERMALLTGVDEEQDDWDRCCYDPNCRCDPDECDC
jgi:hypothetical protein